jgi:hypothetical protein
LLLVAVKNNLFVIISDILMFDRLYVCVCTVLGLVLGFELRALCSLAGALLLELCSQTFCL